jgi:hypothetical protein
MEQPVQVLADLVEDVGGDLREADLALLRLREATCEDSEGNGCDVRTARESNGIMGVGWKR